MIQVYCFDFDGTLVDSNDIKRKVMMETVGHLDGGPAFVDALHDQYPPLDRYGIFGGVGQHYDLDAMAVEALLQAFSDRVNDAVIACDWMPGAENLLQRLQQAGKPAYLNSATPEVDLTAIAKGRGMDGYFRGIHGRPSGKLDNLERARQDAGCRPEDMMMLGDGADDQQAAQAFGCHFRAVFAFRGIREDGMQVLQHYNQLDLP